MKKYRHLIAPDDHYDADDEDYHIIEPPTPALISQFWHAAHTSSAAFKAGPSSSRVLWNEHRLVYCIDDRGQNFLHMAAEVGDPQTVYHLSIMFHDRHGKFPQHVRDIQEQVPRQRDVDGNMPLHIAAANDNLEFVKALLQYHTFGWPSDSLPSFSSHIEKEHYATRWDVRYILPLIEFKNKARRTAEQEAWRCGATRTAQWLHTMRSNYIAAYEPDEEEEDEEDGEEQEEKEDDVPVSQSAQRPSGSRVLQMMCTCVAMVLVMFLLDHARGHREASAGKAL